MLPITRYRTSTGGRAGSRTVKTPRGRDSNKARVPLNRAAGRHDTAHYSSVFRDRHRHQTIDLAARNDSMIRTHNWNLRWNHSEKSCRLHAQHTNSFTLDNPATRVFKSPVPNPPMARFPRTLAERYRAALKFKKEKNCVFNVLLQFRAVHISRQGSLFKTGAPLLCARNKSKRKR